MARRYVFRDKHPGARYFAADGRALDDAHQQQQKRRPQADLRVGRQQAHDQGRHGHHEDAQREHLLAAEQVAKVRHDDLDFRAQVYHIRRNPGDQPAAAKEVRLLCNSIVFTINTDMFQLVYRLRLVRL